MSFRELDKVINLPKDINYIIYKYWSNICEDCNNEIDYCEDCELFYCFCNKNISECYLCKKIFCQLVHDVFYKISFKHNLLLCNTCWNIDDWSRFKEKNNKEPDSYNY